MPDQDSPKPQRLEVPDGMMEVWDAKGKQIILVPAAKTGPDRITLTIRLHDAAEKKDAAKSTSWATLYVDREDLKLSSEEFIAKYVASLVSAVLDRMKPSS